MIQKLSQWAAFPPASGDAYGATWRELHQGNASTLGPLRPVRRLPPPARRPRTGGRAGPVAGTAGHRRAGRAYRGVAHGPAGLAASAATVHRPRVPADAEGGPPAR